MNLPLILLKLATLLILQLLNQKVKFFQMNTFNIPVNGMDKYDLLNSTGFPNFKKYTFKNKDALLDPVDALLSLHLYSSTKISTAMKEKFQMHCTATYTWNGINQMWVLKNVANLKAQPLSNKEDKNFRHLDTLHYHSS
jgi:hypothetical protein